MTSRSLVKLAAGAALALAGLAGTGAASAAVTQGPGCSSPSAGQVTCEFWAKAGTLAVPGGSVDVLGYAPAVDAAPMLPGPTIVAGVGDTVSVTLHNGLDRPSGILFQEQVLPTDTDGVAPDGTKTYTFTAGQAGTYLYEATPFAVTTGGSQYQAAMGMTGALVVRPAAAGQAYADADSAFDAEHLVVVTELDKDITQANAPTFDMRDYAPEYFLINGKAAPDTALLPADAGQRVLLRYVNGGIKAHSMALLGAGQTVVGEDGNHLDNPRRMVAETMGAGQTEDAIVTLPATAGGRYPLYDAGLWLNNGAAAGMGGMLTYLDVTPAATGPDQAGPGTTNVAFAAGDVTADISDAATGGSTVNAFEYMVDQVTAPGASGNVTPVASPAVSVSVTATPTLSGGSHTIYVRGRDDQGNWGPVSSVIVASTGPDATGPSVKGLSLSPDPTNGTVDIDLGATGDDTATGGADIDRGRWRIDGGAWTEMPPVSTGPYAAIDTTVPKAAVAALSEGTHQVEVEARDASGNWGDPAQIALHVDLTGPATTGATATPNPADGVTGVNASTPAVRVSATVADPVRSTVNSRIARGEGFIGAVGADGTGFPLVPADGALDGTSETLRADIPNADVAALADGTHPVFLHGKDAAGNWGATAQINLVVDKHAPVLSGLTATPNPLTGLNTTFAVAASATDLTGVTAAEWFSGTDPGAGNGRPLTVSGGAGTWTIGGTVDYTSVACANTRQKTFSVRARDPLGHWSAPVSVTVNASWPTVIFLDGFQPGDGSCWSLTTNGGNRLSFPGQANMAGTGPAGMAVALGGNTAGTAGSAYVTDNTPNNEAVYRARFYINANNSRPGDPGPNGTGVVVLGGYGNNNGSGSRFAVRFRQSGTAFNSSRQVRLEVSQPANQVQATAWVTIPSSGATWAEVSWTASGTNATTVTLTVNGTTQPALSNVNVGTGNNRIGSVRLGVQGLGGTNNTRFGSVYLDTFLSTRGTTAIGPVSALTTASSASVTATTTRQALAARARAARARAARMRAARVRAARRRAARLRAAHRAHRGSR